MSRKNAHEHQNHEAWAIPYGDLVTLLLAFFVVMYSISSVNEGKYRVVSDSLFEAFGGRSPTLEPVEIGHAQMQATRGPHLASFINPHPKETVAAKINSGLPAEARARWAREHGLDTGRDDKKSERLEQVATHIEQTLKHLIQENLVSVYRQDDWVEVEIKADVLFTSGSAMPRTDAVPIIAEIANILRDSHNLIRIEGHTDNLPIHTLQFPSNWELSASRAASVVRLFTQEGVDPSLMQVVGYGDHQPIGDNATPEGRNANRRVVLVISLQPISTENGANPAGEPSSIHAPETPNPTTSTQVPWLPQPPQIMPH